MVWHIKSHLYSKFTIMMLTWRMTHVTEPRRRPALKYTVFVASLEMAEKNMQLMPAMNHSDEEERQLVSSAERSGGFKDLHVNYNYIVQEQNNKITIEGSKIESMSVGQTDKRSSVTAFPRTGESNYQPGTIEDINSPDVTWLSPKLKMFNKRPLSRQPNSKVYHGKQEIGGSCRDVTVKLIPYSDKNLEEVRTLAKLNHPNVVQIYEAGECHGYGHWIYIVMELCLMNLEEYVEKNRSDVTKAFSFTKQLVSAVAYLHENNIAHRDIKPSNILISKCGNFIKVSDFGISKEIPFGATSATTTSNGAGTEGFKSPEAYNPVYRISLCSDIFSLGLVTAYLFSHGKHPFGDDPLDWGYKIRKNMRFDLSQISSEIPKREHRIYWIRQMLQHAPCKRPTAEQISKEFVFSEISPDVAPDGKSDNESLYAVDVQETHSMVFANSGVALHNDTGIPTIVLFNKKSKHLYHFNIVNKSMTKMQQYPDDVVDANFFAVAIDKYIYVLQRRVVDHGSLYRLDYGDGTATWERKHQGREVHGWGATRVVASRDSIFLLGGEGQKPSQSISKYNPLSDNLDRLPDKPTATSGPALLCNSKFLYCIGGFLDESGDPTCTAERMDLQTTEWSRIEDVNRRGRVRCAAECKGKIFLFFDGWNRLCVESWDPLHDKWTEIKMADSDKLLSEMRKFDGSWLKEAFPVGESLYLVGRSGILGYDVEKSELTIVTTYRYMTVKAAVMVNMPV